MRAGSEGSLKRFPRIKKGLSVNRIRRRSATVMGTAFFIASIPFSALSGNDNEDFHELVIDPARFTFKRPLGKPQDSW
jgi:hypothetical protein